MSKPITVTLDGRELSSFCGVLLSEAVRGESPCGGHGKCGKCRIIAEGELSPVTEDEKKLLSKEEIASGVRLACLTRAMGDCKVTTLTKNTARIVTDGDMPNIKPSPSFALYGAAIDIGTTTLAARLYDREGTLLSSDSRLNPQAAFGADVISRIEASMRGDAAALATAIRQEIDAILTSLAKEADIRPSDIGELTVTGNTVMLSLLCEEEVEPLSHAPFKAKRLFGETLSAQTLNLAVLNPDTPVYLPPSISAFVGADTTCAILATELTSYDCAILTDIGTNGEMALYHKGALTVCSTAAGPAFEGVGISMGMRGTDGAIDKVKIENGGLIAHVIGECAPIGICGSGLVDAAACMLELGITDESGYLEEDEVISGEVALTPKDIRMLQLAKSAICAGLLTLIESSGLDCESITALYIAGGFGKYLGTDNAARIGLLPRKLAQKARAVGNAALAGASMLLLCPEYREKARQLASRATTLDLSTNDTFLDKYVEGMMLEEI